MSAIAPAAAAAAATRQTVDPLPVVRETVRELLMASPAYAALDDERRRALARDMVRVCHAAAMLVREEMDASSETSEAPDEPARPGSTAMATESDRARTARAMGGALPFGTAADRIAGTTRAVLNAVSFPRFVADLINGVFRAMLDSSSQQMESYVNLLNAVAASTDGFGDSNIGPARARAWLLEHYPESYELESEVDELDPDATPEEQAEAAQERQEIKVRMRAGGRPPSEEALRADLGLAPNESVPIVGDPERNLVPLVRRRLAKMRQEMLATMVMLGMQRIVVDSGRIAASMRFHIDTRSALAHDEGSRLGIDNEISASGKYGFGPWGVSAAVKNNISYVSTQRTQSTEEMNTDLDLNSSVEINFKSDYLPLNRLASPGQAEAIRANTRNPAAEAAAADRRGTEQRKAEDARRQSLDDLLKPQQGQTPPAGGGTSESRPSQGPQTATQPNAQPGRQPNAQPGGQPNAQPGQPNAQPGGQPQQPPAPTGGGQTGSGGAQNQPGTGQTTRTAEQPRPNQPSNQPSNQPPAPPGDRAAAQQPQSRPAPPPPRR